MSRDRAVWFSLGLMVGCLVAATAVGQPVLRVLANDKVWDLTDERSTGIRVGEVVEHEFPVRNAGTAPLEILEATPQESCLAVTLPEGPIEASGEGKIKVVLDTVGMEPSLLETYIVVKSNDPASETRPTVLTVKAKIIPKPETILLVQPQVRDVGPVRVGETTRLTYTYENAGTTDFSLRSLRPLYNERLSVVTDIEAGVMKAGGKKEFVLNFTPQAGDEGRKLETLFTIRTDPDEQPSVICRVEAYVLPKEEGVQIIPTFQQAPAPPCYLFELANHTTRPVRVMCLRDGTEFDSRVLAPGDSRTVRASAVDADDLSAFSFTIQPFWAAMGAETDGDETPEETAPDGVETTEEATPEQPE